jgi:hypothetical protein
VEEGCEEETDEPYAQGGYHISGGDTHYAS